MQNATPIQLFGPSRLPAAGGQPKQLVVFLHGYGADGNDLISLAPFFARALPHAAFVAPNAPERCAMGHGYQWFDVDRLNPPMVRAAASRAAPILDAFIDRELAARGLSTSNLALIGFSQGTVMALDRAMRGGKSAATVGFSGMVSAAADALPPEADRPPILLVHGTADTIVAFTYLAEGEKILSGAGFKVDTLVRPGLAHGIDQEGALAAARFLVAHLA